jgi:4-diphosphocytidyl-2-C-methyl-D-erythritol kinase
MVAFPNCKINLGLRVLRKRSDGYHDIETIFYPLQICDILEITNYQQKGRSAALPFTLTGIDINGEAQNNLCIKAYKLLKKDFPGLPLIQMNLHKSVPAGSGLGGGSADAAFTLTLLNNKFHLNLTEKKLLDYAAELGSDCPFFIINKPCYATGRGEQLETIQLDLSAYTIIVVNPGIHINTGQAFLSVTPGSNKKSLKEIITAPVEEWKDKLVNDFEEYISNEHPEIAEIKNQLYSSGALYSSMSGSGSTVYGVFKTSPPALKFPDHYFVKKLSGRLQ